MPEVGVSIAFIFKFYLLLINSIINDTIFSSNSLKIGKHKISLQILSAAGSFSAAAEGKPR